MGVVEVAERGDSKEGEKLAKASRVVNERNAEEEGVGLLAFGDKGEEGHKRGMCSIQIRRVQKLNKTIHMSVMCSIVSVTNPCVTLVQHGYTHQINVLCFLGNKNLYCKP